MAGENMSGDVGLIAGALARAQSSLGKLIADKKVLNKDKKTTRYLYADLADALEACRSTLNKEEIAIIQLPATSERNGVEVVTMMIHSSGQWLRSSPLFMPVSGGAQDVGSAITYARRYQLLAMVGLAPEDDDGKAAQGAKPDSWGTSPPRKPTTPRRPPDLGARCSGKKGSSIANANARRRDAIASHDKAKPAAVWGWALGEAKIEQGKYAGFGLSPEKLTIDDGVKVRAILKLAAGRKGVDDVEDPKGVP